jgi:hypothetical protein
MKAHSRTKPLLDLAGPFSVLMQQIETGNYNTAAGAQLLFTLGTPTERNAENVIDQYYLATEHDLKAVSAAPTQRASAARSLPAPRTPARANGHVKKTPVH